MLFIVNIKLVDPVIFFVKLYRAIELLQYFQLTNAIG